MRRISIVGLVCGWVLVASPVLAQVCNGSADLCDRGFDEVAYLTTHNAHASTADGYVLFNGNQTYTMTRQLEDGVRGLMIDMHEHEGVVSLCHGPCGLANKPLEAGLVEIADFLGSHPTEVVTIIFESYVSASRAADVFEAVGILDPVAPDQDLLYEHDGGAWPSLGELIAADERLVVFSDVNEQGSFPWYHYLWSSLVFETHWSVDSLADFNCNDNRGQPSNDLFILNHFITGPLGGTPALAGQANASPFFLTRAEQCQSLHSHIPNFVTVDYYEVGTGLAVVDALNGIEVACSDLDGDGYGSPAAAACDFPQFDCDDGDATVNPGAAEIPGNGIDDDCDPGTPAGCGGQ